MVEVSSGSSRGVLISDSHIESRTAFDLNSWQGLTEVLQAARKGLNGDSYAAFRDTVLEYAQSGGDAVQKEKILKTISSFGNVRVTEAISESVASNDGQTAVSDKPNDPGSRTQEGETKKEAAAPKESSAGMFVMPGRPVPTFMAPQHTSDRTDQVESKPAPMITDEKDVPRRESATSEQSFIPENLPVHRETDATYEHSKAEAEEPVAKDVKTPQPPQRPEQKLPPKMDVAPAVPKKTVSELQVSAEKKEVHKKRIAEIKHEVNTTIGNPASLIDSGNETGKQYMSALLEAMKAMSGGQAGSLDLAMAKLEKAYELMTEAVKKGAFKKEEKPSIEKVKEEEAAKEETKIPDAVNERTAPLIPRDEKPLPNMPVQPTPEKEPARPVEPIVEQVQAQAPALETALQTENGGADRMPEKTNAQIPSLADLTERKGSVTEEVAEPQSTVTNSPNQEAIATPEVTKALNQLLDEWVLFKSSGIFGTGAGGAENQLYRKLKDLSMFAVLGGRWERSSSDITQTIKDYVNAWRHEQGVTYNPSETFEHYLRRVVLRILERQKQ